MRPIELNNAMMTILRGLTTAVLVTVVSTTVAAKEPQKIRQYLLEEADKSVTAVKSVEPFQAEALDDLVTTRIWKVAYSSEGNDGESLVFMAVKDGEVLRIRDFEDPSSRDNFVRLLPEDFRVTSEADARRLVAATLDLYFGFPFSEPDKTVDEMHMEKRDGEYFFVDGERFSDATGYHISTDEEGRVTGYEYSWELPVDLP